MALFRIQHNDFEQRFNFDHFDTLHPNEWENDNRINELGWEERYNYEALLINNIIKNRLNSDQFNYQGLIHYLKNIPKKYLLAGLNS